MTQHDTSRQPQRPTTTNPLDQPETDTPSGSTDCPAQWASLYTLLAEAFKHPDKRFYEDVRQGRFGAELDQLANTLSLSLPDDGAADTVPETTAAFDNEYITLYEGLTTPYAPVVESVYRHWHGDARSDGLLSGPAAADMRHRYEAAAMTPPRGYEPDHLALLFEYAAALLRADQHSAYRTFVAQHLDWLPALRQLTTAAAATAPFHTYCVDVACECVTAVFEREHIAPPRQAAIETMHDRAMRHIE